MIRFGFYGLRISYFSLKFIAVICLIAFIIGIILKVKGIFSNIQVFSLVLITFWLSFVFSITIMDRKANKKYRYKLIPFKCYSDYFIYGKHRREVIEKSLNVFLLMPFGFGISALLKNSNLKKISLCGFCVSAFIEIIQLITKRGWFEFDDIIHNTFGVVIGYMLYLLFKKIIYIIAKYDSYSNGVRT